VVGRGEFGTGQVPILGEMRYRRTSRGGLAEVTRTECPRGHRLDQPGALQVGWHPGHRARSDTCTRCEADGLPPSWCLRVG
jgi:hypothetical protein